MDNERYHGCLRGPRGPVGGIDGTIKELSESMKRLHNEDIDGNQYVIVDWWNVEQAIELLKEYKLLIEQRKEV